MDLARVLARIACAVLAAGIATGARAQAGPPLITNDPGTPGDGHWEINAAAIGSVEHGTWEYSLPDFDVNYGLGDHIQLSIQTGWNHRTGDGRTESGGEAVEFAARWRFLDEETSGIDLAVQPAWASPGPDASVRKDLAPAHAEFSLPLQAAKKFGEVTVGAEVVRHFIAAEPDEWQAGLWASHECTKKLECLAEVNATWTPGEAAATIADLGFRYALVEEKLLLMGALGRQVGGDEHPTVFYLGLQVLR